jgi:midasin
MSEEIIRLRKELDLIFEWHDGILVEAMTKGGLLLIDEISLASDSVLE